MHQATVSAQGRLVVVPIPDDVTEPDLLSAVGSFLEGHRTVPHCAAVVTWSEDGALLARDLEADDGCSSPSTLRSALGPLLSELFGTNVTTSWDASGAPHRESGVDDLSLSFLREVHDFVTPKTSFVALLTDWVDPGTIVRELRHIHGVRVIYGGVPTRSSAKLA